MAALSFPSPGGRQEAKNEKTRLINKESEFDAKFNLPYVA